GVVADQRDALELQRGEEVGDYLRESQRRQVGARVQRNLVRTERPVGHEHPEVGAEAASDLSPQLAVRQQTVHEHDRLARSHFSVADPPLWEPYLGRLCPGHGFLLVFRWLASPLRRRRRNGAHARGVLMTVAI